MTPPKDKHVEESMGDDGVSELLKIVREIHRRQIANGGIGEAFKQVITVDCDAKHKEALSPRAIVSSFRADPIAQIVFAVVIAAGSGVLGWLGYTWETAGSVATQAEILEVEQRQLREVVQDLKQVPEQIRVLDHKIERLKGGGS